MFGLLAAALILPSQAALSLQVTDATVPPAPAGASVAVHMLLTNPTSTTLQLVGATTPVAQTQLQAYAKTPDGLVQAHGLNGLTIPAGQSVVLLPRTTELQLVGLTQTLEAGLEIPLKLQFADGTTRIIRLKIQEENESPNHDETSH